MFGRLVFLVNEKGYKNTHDFELWMKLCLEYNKAICEK